ncbi:unnamed protein product [Ceratitis capitata]|uniref:(Mediterranean fruit fly) hypothetical protein n=1 Tax=Ceratitis capitata TaxID=7213 RepID=A0A811UG05_CERCA|nr:unnamed protein product [Ceratitis capitata]
MTSWLLSNKGIWASGPLCMARTDAWALEEANRAVLKVSECPSHQFRDKGLSAAAVALRQ